MINRRLTGCSGMLLLLIGRCAPGIAALPVQPPLPQSCQLGSTASQVDFGNLTLAQLKERDEDQAQPAARSLEISVLCRYPQRMRLRLIGDRHGEAFRWGNRGMLQITLKGAQLDNQPVAWVSPAAGQHKSSRLQLQPGETFGLAESQRGRQLTFRMEITPLLEQGQASLSRQQLAAYLSLQLIN